MGFEGVDLQAISLSSFPGCLRKIVGIPTIRSTSLRDSRTTIMRGSVKPKKTQDEPAGFDARNVRVNSGLGLVFEAQSGGITNPAVQAIVRQNEQSFSWSTDVLGSSLSVRSCHCASAKTLVSCTGGSRPRSSSYHFQSARSSLSSVAFLERLA